MEEEVVGMDLQKRRRSHHIHMIAKVYSPANSESSITSESSTNDTSFDINSANVDVDVDVVTNGENPTIVQHLSEDYNEIDAVPDDDEEDEKDGNFEEPINGESGIHVGNFENENENEETNGFSVNQNGADVAHLSSESDEADEEVRVGSNGTTFSTGPDTAVGLKYVESLLDESSSSVNGKLADITTAEQNIVNKILKSGDNELGPEAAEYDVEGVLLKQETYDLYCPYCNRCITKRVILRKRKRQDISTDEEIISSGPGQNPAGSGRDHNEIVETSPENGVGQNEGAGNGSVDALTCFSCLKIFISTGKGFLCWKFGSKPDTDLLPESPRDIPRQAESSLTTEAEAPSGNTVTNASIDKDTGRLSTKPPQDIPQEAQNVPAVKTLADATKDGDRLSTKPSQDICQQVQEIPAVKTSADATKDGDLLSTKPPQDIHQHAQDVPAVKSSADATKDGDRLSTKPSQDIRQHAQDIPAVETSADATKDGDRLSTKPPQDIHQHAQDVPAVKTLADATKDGDRLSSKPSQDIRQQAQDIPAVKTSADATKDGAIRIQDVSLPKAKGWNFSLSSWFSASADRLSTKPPPDIRQQAENVPTVKTSADATKDGDVSSPPDLVSDIPDEGTAVSLQSKPSVTPDIVTPLSSDPEPAITPDDNLSPPDPKLHVTPDPDDVPDIRVQLLVSPGQRRRHKLTAIPPDDPPPTTDLVENLEGQLPRDLPNRGVSGLDVIRAIVYGGLLETIASLSIIASAAGGDATTLNIVALGLANVFGGLIVLFHNLRELKNDPIPEHYEEQLGRQGHFLLHATIAFISYLVFGLMAPVIYGFSFRKSDDKNLKLITLAAASIVCITILSIAKAYVQRPPKNYFKTIFYYATIGVMVSGLGYVSGELINDALKELGVFDLRSPVNMSVLETGAVNAALSSY